MDNFAEAIRGQVIRPGHPDYESALAAAKKLVDGTAASA